MYTPQNQTILLISNEIGRLEYLTLVLQEIGYKVISANDGRMGFRLIRRESPDLVISEMKLPGITGLELCRMIRADRELWTTPLVFLGGTLQNDKKITEFFRAGADDCFADISNPEYLAAKIQWLIEKKYAENHLIRYYQNLGCRQLQISQIIKGASDLFSMSSLADKTASLDEVNLREIEKSLIKKMDLGMNMIDALSHLLEEHVNAFELWARAQRGSDFILDQEYTSEPSALDYDYITYDLIENDLMAN